MDNTTPRHNPPSTKPPVPKDRNRRARQKVLAKQRDAATMKTATAIQEQISQLSGRRDDLRDKLAEKFLADGHVGGIPVHTREQALAAAEIILTDAAELSGAPEVVSVDVP